MYYAIFGVDKPNSLQDRLAARPDHLERIKQLQADGRLLLAGPHPAIDSPDPGPAGFTGSLIIADFPDLESATRWAESDPYTTQGIFESVTVKPFNKVLP
jgi:uncharacterized protein YciI